MESIFFTLIYLTILHVTNLIYANDINFKKILDDTLTKGKKLGEGNLGIVYSDPSNQYVIKERKVSEDKNKDDSISEGDKNKFLFKDIKLLDDQAFYKEI